MASTTCAYCGRLTHMTHQWSDIVERDSGYDVLQGAATCDNCYRVSVGWKLIGNEYSSSTSLFNESEDLRWQPLKVASPEFPDVPEHISKAATEAHICAAVGARMAAILMARTVVEATAKAKGITSGDLYKKIDNMAAQDFIRKSTQEAAHEIRHFGNDMAHGDITEVPKKDDVADVLELMDEVLNEVFQGPARTQRVKERRLNPQRSEADTSPATDSYVHPG